jgi:uncharacterized protein (DUF2147 family)
MYKIILPLVFILCTQLTKAQNQIVGKWTSEDKKGVIEVFEQNGQYFGKLTTIKTPNDENGLPKKDAKNPSPALRNQALLNLVILKNFQYSDNQWSGGTIYDPNNGKTYTCKMWLTDNNTLKIRGYLGPFFRTQTWTR